MSLYPWSCSDEWNDVFELLYSSETERQRTGLARVAAWKARGVIPALLEVTADIVSCLVHEEDCAKCPHFSGHVLQLMYAMALTRFVNGVFDVHYVTNPGLGKDIKTVLGHFGIPSYIVTLRHDCAHRSLPPLEALQCAATAGMQWLLSNYWEPQRQHNQQQKDSNVVKEVGDVVRFGVEHTSKMSAKRVLSDCSVIDLALKLLRGQMWRIANYKVTFPEASEQQQMLPQLKVEGRVFAQWWCRVKRVAKSQPGMVTMVLSAIIIAMHHAECTVRRRKFLAGSLGQVLQSEGPKGPWINAGSVDWCRVLAVIQQNPGSYSEALMNNVLPRVSGQLPTGVINQNKQLTKLVSLSEKFSQCAYNRPLNKARHVQLGTEVTSGFHTRLRSDDSDSDCVILQESPPSKRARRDNTSKWSVITDMEECKVGLCPGKEVSSDFLHLNFLHQQSEPTHTNADKGIGAAGINSGMCDQQTFSKSKVARIQTNIRKRVCL